MQFKLDPLTGFKRSVTIHLDGRVMCEDIIATANRTDKAETFGIIKPFNSTHLHAVKSLCKDTQNWG